MQTIAEQPINPPYVDAPYREIQDEQSIRDALAELDELESSIRYLSRHKPDLLVMREAYHSPYLVIRAWRRQLREMLGED